MKLQIDGQDFEDLERAVDTHSIVYAVEFVQSEGKEEVKGEYSDNVFVMAGNSGRKHSLRCRHYKDSGIVKLNMDGVYNDFETMQIEDLKNAAQTFYLDLIESVYKSTLQYNVKKGEMKLIVDEVKFKKLPPFTECVPVHRSLIDNNFRYKVKYTELTLKIGGKKIVVRGQYDAKSKALKLEQGKRKVVKTFQKLNDFKDSLVLVLPEFNLKFVMKLSEDGKEFAFEVNGRSLFAFPYNYDPD